MTQVSTLQLLLSLLHLTQLQPVVLLSPRQLSILPQLLLSFLLLQALLHRLW